ncbi:MAG TPA: SHOCT domain-containing protein [Candidatus Nanopelagicales bacterium]|nr:SHOCT domain-containing protein [Candidatus Nanopelagicales bacterium]
MDPVTLALGALLVGGAVALLFVAVRWLARNLFGPRRRLEAELGREALERRLARGEITREEFEQAKRALGA